MRLWALRLLPGPPALCQLADLQAHSGAINHLELHHPTGMLASAGYDGSIWLWKLQSSTQQSGTQRPQLARRGCLVAGACAAPVAACAFSSCGTFLASCSLDGIVRLWEVGADRQLLGEVQLQASSIAFAPGDDAALLVVPVADSGEGEGLGLGPTQQSRLAPLLLDLRQVPACHRYCTQLAGSQQRQEAGSGGSQTTGTEALPAAAAAAAGLMHPAAAMWLPDSPGQAAAAGEPHAAAGAPLAATSGVAAGRLPAAGDAAASAAATAAAAAAAAAVPPGSTLSAAPGSISQPQCRTPHRQAGSVIAFSRKKRRRQERQEGAEEAAPQGTADRAGWGAASECSPCSWLPGGDSALRPPAAAAGWGGGLFGAWSTPLSPASPLSTAAAPSAAAGEPGEGADGFGSVPLAAVVARYWAPPDSQTGSGNGSAGDSRGSGGSMFDTATKEFVYRQVTNMGWGRAWGRVAFGGLARVSALGASMLPGKGEMVKGEVWARSYTYCPLAALHRGTPHEPACWALAGVHSSFASAQ